MHGERAINCIYKNGHQCAAEFRTEGADTVKAMFWNGLVAVEPLCSAETNGKITIQTKKTERLKAVPFF